MLENHQYYTWWNPYDPLFLPLTWMEVTSAPTWITTAVTVDYSDARTASRPQTNVFIDPLTWQAIHTGHYADLQ